MESRAGDGCAKLETLTRHGGHLIGSDPLSWANR